MRAPLAFAMAMLAWLLTAAAALAQQQLYPSPTLAAATVQGLISTTTLAVSGTSTMTGGGTMAGLFAGPTVLTSVQPTLKNVSTSGLPASPSPGTMVFVTDCLNGGQTIGFGTGCAYVANTNSVWVNMASPPNQTITIGGQGISLGGTTNNQGNGNKLQLSTGTVTNGHCAQFDANGNIVDAGAGCGGGGGGGTVSAGTINQLGYYAAGGTTISGLSTANNGVLVTNGSGAPSIATTLPTSITIPTATISNPAITGTATAVTVNMSGKLTTAGSVTGGANFSCPQGTAPSSPGNGDVWCTTAGMFGRFNSTTVGPFIDRTAVSATSPVSYNNGTGVFSCPTCLTASGGALAVTAPIALSGNTISLNELTTPAAILIWNASTTVTNDSYLFYWPHATGHITSVKYYTAGTSTPSFSVALQVNGVNVTGCSAISVTSANTQLSPGTTSCTSTAITTGQSFSISTSAVAGAPASAMVEVIGTASGS